MECPNCKLDNPEGNKFCGACGALLDQKQWSVNDFRSYLQNEIRVAFKDEFKDRQAIETETAQRIAEKLAGWAKLFGAFVGIPLTIILFLAGLLGVKSYTDISTAITTARSDITTKLGKAKDDADHLIAEIEKRKTDLAKLDAVSTELKSLGNKVKDLEDKLTFEPSSALTPDVQSSIQSSLDAFQSYLVKLGYKSKTHQTTVYIDPNMQTPNVWYDPSKNRIVLAKQLASDKDAVFREFTHHALFESSDWTKLTEQWPALAIESALADYFPCSFNNDAAMGDAGIYQKLYGKEAFPNPYLRNLKNNRKFTTISAQTEYHDAGEIWGGAFWELRETLGQDKADRLIFLASTKLTEADGSNIAANLVEKLVAVDEELEGGTDVGQIRSVFEGRGLKLR
jgi:hypothetical protein